MKEQQQGCVTNEQQSDSRMTSEELLPIVYEELRRLAASKMARETPGQTLSATALVHEAYCRIHRDFERSGRWDNRGHFFAAAAEAMRRILVDNARKKQTRKHGGNAKRVRSDSSALFPDQNSSQFEHELIDFNEVLKSFEAEHPGKAALVKLRYFSGLSLKEAAECLGIADHVAKRRWKFSKAWLRSKLN